jgi:rubrerythrin
MKYLEALLRDEKISPDSYGKALTKPTKALLSVLSGSSPESTPKIEEASRGLPWLCSECGNPAEIDEVCPSLDGERTLTLWHCEPCQRYGATPDEVRQPPVWVTKKEQ